MGYSKESWKATLWIVTVYLLVGVRCNRLEKEARIFMDILDKNYTKLCSVYSQVSWQFNTDLENKTAKDNLNAFAVEYATFASNSSKLVKKYDYKSFKDGSLYRRFRFLKDEGTGGLDKALLKEYQEIKSEMKTIYSTGKICSYNDPNPNNCTKLPLTPDLSNILAKERDWDKLKYVWEEWRVATGQKIRTLYSRFVELSNAAAKIDGYANAGDSWLSSYTVDQKEVEHFDPHGIHSLKVITQADFRNSVDRVWNQVSTSLYKKLHAFVRLKLQNHYGNRIKSNGLLPAHILGNMWAQSWGNIGDLVNPFPDEPVFDVSDSMVANNWTITKMFKESESFFTSLGLFPMTQTFWKKSIIDKSKWDKPLVCHASAWDMCNGPGSEDFRIKMCTQVDMDDLVTVHHEMGHTEYQMAYRDLPLVFRTSANPGFHEAIGDLIALSVSTPDHLTQVLGLSPKLAVTEAAPTNNKYTSEQKRDINFLMSMALDKIVFLPFGYLMDKYRWQLFDGNITEATMNEGWWKLREEIQGVTPPSGPRGEEFFDPGAKYHIPANTPYVRYFVSFIHQFQFHKHLCSIKGHVGPLHKCNIYQDKKAGKVLREALELGFAEPWPLVLQKLAGSLVMDASAIEEYFQPLIAFLDEQLEGKCVGWGSSIVDATLCNSG